MQIAGKCHCGKISFTLDWPGEPASIAARVCSCSFCVKHGGRWTSHPGAALEVRLADAAATAKYRFGTKTADFHVCTGCGVVPVATFERNGRVFAVVNVNTFEKFDAARLEQSGVSFDGEGVGDRLDRRERNWIGAVRFTVES